MASVPPAFTIPCAVPLLPVNVELLPNGIALSQGLTSVVLDDSALNPFFSVVGILVLARLGAMTARPPSPIIEI